MPAIGYASGRALTVRMKATESGIVGGGGEGGGARQGGRIQCGLSVLQASP